MRGSIRLSNENENNLTSLRSWRAFAVASYGGTPTTTVVDRQSVSGHAFDHEARVRLACRLTDGNPLEVAGGNRPISQLSPPCRGGGSRGLKGMG